jgi:hypothetical protein
VLAGDVNLKAVELWVGDDVGLELARATWVRPELVLGSAAVHPHGTHNC